MGIVELPERLSLAQAAKALGICERTVLRRIEDGTLRGGKIGGRWYTLAEWVRDYVEGGGDWQGPENEQPRGSKSIQTAASNTSTGTIQRPAGLNASLLVAGMKRPPTRRSRSTS